MLDIDDDDAVDGTEADDNDAPPSADGPVHVTRELECVLSDTEVRERGQIMAQDEREIERLKIRRKALNAQIRAKFEHMTECALAIDSRKEVREVQCTWRPDYEKNIWELQRDDTKRVVTTRAMTAVDLQTRLPLESVTKANATEDAGDADDGDGAGDVDDDDDGYGDDIDDAELDTALDHLRDMGPVEVTDDDGGDDAVVEVTDPTYAARMRDIVDRAELVEEAPPSLQSRAAAAAHLLPARSTPESIAAVAAIRSRPTKPAKPSAGAGAGAIKRGPKVRTRAANTNGRSSKRR